MNQEKVPSRTHSDLKTFQLDTVHALISHFHLERLLQGNPERPIGAMFMFVSGFISVAVLAGLAMIAHTPFVFPSLGPTVILLFLYPSSPTSFPRQTLYGHGIGILGGYGSLWVTGLRHAAPATIVGVDHARIIAAALSVALTGSLMVLLKAIHPPAGSTTLIVSLGIITRPFDLLIIEIAVSLLALQSIIVNRLTGVDYPLWDKRVVVPAPPANRTGEATVPPI